MFELLGADGEVQLDITFNSSRWSVSGEVL